MALWLFRRKSRRKRARSSTLSGDEAPRPVPRSQTVPEPDATTAPTRQQSKKRQRVESGPTKLQRRARTYSFESGRRDSLHVHHAKAPRRPGEPAPPLPATRPTGSGTDSDRHPGRDGVVDDYDFERVPTLHANKRDGQHLKQRSSKRRKNSHDREREAELKAMSNFVPVRPATDAWAAGRPMKKDTKRVRSGLGLGFGSGRVDRERGSSDISLPIAESIHSSMSSDSDQVAYKISALDALAPKPTLRVSSFPRWALPSHGSVLRRMSLQQRRVSEKAPIPEATLKAHKRIHELADDLSASDLRELMERDQRRREKRRQKEQERVEKRLARRAEKQRLAAEDGAQNLERGVIGREVGLGIDPSSAIRTSSRRRQSDASQTQPATAGEAAEQPAQPRPAAFHRTSSVPLEVPTPAQEPEEPVPELPRSPKRRGFLRVKKSRDKSPVVPLEKQDTSDTPRKGSEAGSSRGPSWTSIFRWGNKKRASGPSSFSNTSRDSMGTQTQPAANAAPSAPSAPTAAIVPSRNMNAGVRRTLSRFREDLPDFLMSPPDSRAQSPELETVPTIAEQHSPPAAAEAETSPSGQEQRYGTPTSDGRSYDMDEMGQTPGSVRHSAIGPSPEPQHSMSMASIDSEASWLSGRLGSRSRASQQRHTPTSMSHPYPSAQRRHASVDTLTTHEHEEAPEEEAAGDAEADMARQDGRLSMDDEKNAQYGAVGERHPHVVAAHSFKSREGLLKTGDDDSEADLDSPISPISTDTKDDEAGLQRATSVNLGQRHARHISAGSAKLLELSPRSSVDNRRSFEPRT